MEARLTSHPSAESLRALALGKLDDNTAAAVLSHLDICPECRGEVAAATNDDFLNRLRQVRQPSGTPAPAQPLAKGVVSPQPAAAPTTLFNVPPELADHPQYEILRELGRGGMGIVYLTKNKLMDRLEVLKVLNKDLLNHPGAVERFLREIRAAARLSHPNVVVAYSALQLGDLLVFAMEYIDGEDLHAVVKARGPLPVVNACQYVQQAAIGLQHAFEKGMVHRDIKPQNLILAREGKRHIVKILDFGLAKATREKTDDTGLTGEGQMMGTPDYMAPEQSLDAASADIRADVYGLGCTLFYLLTGAPPFRGKSLAAIIMAHQSTEAPPLNQVRAEVSEELSAVVRKMMAKEPAQRYQTPAEVVKALGIAGKLAAKGTPTKSPPDPSPPRPEVEPSAKHDRTIVPASGAAHPTMRGDEMPSVLARAIPAAKTILPGGARPSKSGRNCLPMAWRTGLIGTAVTVVLLLGLIGLWVGGVFQGKTKEGTIGRENVPADAEVVADGETLIPRDREEETPRIPERRTPAEPPKTPPPAPVEEPKKTSPPVPLQPPEKSKERTQPVPAAVRVAEYDLTGGHRFVHFGKAGIRVVLAFNDHEQEQFFARVYDLTTGQALTPPLKHYAELILALLSPDGKHVVTASHDGMTRVWDAATGEVITPPLKLDAPGYYSASFSPDSKRVVTAGSDLTARVCDATTGKEVCPPLKHEMSVRRASFSPDGLRVVTASDDKTARVWDAATGEVITPPLKHDGAVHGASFSPDSKRVVTFGEDKTARVWDAKIGKEVCPPLKHDYQIFHASFSPDGKRVVTASYFAVRVWNAATGEETTPPLRHAEGVSHAAFSPDGKRVVTASNDRTARLWDTATGMEATPPLQHEDWVRHASFSPDGKRVVTAGTQTARIWDAATGKALTSPLKEDWVKDASFSPDGKRMLTISRDQTARVWNPATGKAITPPLKHGQGVLHASFSPDGQRVLTVGQDQTARVWDATTGKEVCPPLQHQDRVYHASFSPDGKRVATASEDSTARVWDAATGKEVCPLLKHEHGMHHVSFSPDGKRVVTARRDYTARVWDADNGEEVCRPLKHGQGVRQASFSPDGQRVLTVSVDGTAQVWDAATGKAITPPFESGVKSAVYSPDGKRVLTVSQYGAAVLDAATGKEVYPSLKYRHRMHHSSFSPDGQRVLTLSVEGTAQVWDAATGKEVCPPLKHEMWVKRASFSPDGQRVLTVSYDYTVRVWDAVTGKELKKVTIAPD